MKVIIPEIPPQGLDLEIQEAIETDVVVSPIKARLRIEKVGAEVIVSGNLEVDVKLQCSRCLEDYSDVLSVPFNVVYHPVEELKREEKHEIKGEEMDLDFYLGEDFDVKNLITEQIMLNLPMKPLCKESCKGMCLKCGADRNKICCQCAAEDIDPRLEALTRFLPKES